MNEFLITLEDRPGSLAECCVALGEAGINIVAGAGIASSSASAALVVKEGEMASQVFDELGIAYALRELHTAVLQDLPGALGEFTRGLAENRVNLKSIYIMKTDADGVHIGYTSE